MTLENLDLPEEGTQPIPISMTSEVAPFYIEAIEELMLDPGGYEAAELVDAYQDPLLDNRKNKLGPATRLWKSGILMVTSHAMRRFAVTMNFVASFLTKEEAISAVPRFINMKLYRLLYLFSGAEHSETLSHHIKLIFGSKRIIAVVPCSSLSPALSKPLPGGGGLKPYRSRTFLVGLPEFEGKRLEDVQHANHLLDKNGKFRTTAAARYPPALNAMIAREHIGHAEAAGIRLVQSGDLTKPIFKDEEIIVQKKVRPPALGEAWKQRGRFRKGCKWIWS